MLKTKIMKASEIISNKEYTKKTSRLIDILKNLNCQKYFSPPGSIEYLMEEKLNFQENEIIQPCLLVGRSRRMNMKHGKKKQRKKRTKERKTDCFYLHCQCLP